MRAHPLWLVLASVLLLLPVESASAARRGRLLQGLRHRLRCCGHRVRCCPSPCKAVADQGAEKAPQAEATPPQPAEPAWRSLFSGEDLGDWKITKFGGEGDVDVQDGELHLGFGQYLTGVTYAGDDLPKNNYEIELEASRVEGFDFFCCLTFPVDDAHCSFVAGGWGGSVVGISSIDDMDASENETTSFQLFEPKKWYKIRVRVTPGKLQAWIDDKVFVDQDVEGRKLSTRIEVDLSIPLGIASFDTHAAVRNIRIRTLPTEAP